MVVNGGVASEGHQANDQEPTATPTGSRPRLMEKTAYMPKDTAIFEAVGETENHELEKLAGNAVMPLKMELLAAMKAEVH